MKMNNNNFNCDSACDYDPNQVMDADGIKLKNLNSEVEQEYCNDEICDEVCNESCDEACDEAYCENDCESVSECEN